MNKKQAVCETVFTYDAEQHVITIREGICSPALILFANQASALTRAFSLFYASVCGGRQTNRPSAAASALTLSISAEFGSYTVIYVSL